MQSTNMIKNFYINLLGVFKDNILILFQVIAAFLMPIKALIFLVGFMIVLDTITGLMKAKKIKEPITSYKLSRVINKMVLYQVGLISFFMIDKFILDSIMHLFINVDYFITKITAIFFVLIEMFSINENITIIKGINLFKMLKSFIKKGKGIRDDFDYMTKGADNSGQENENING